MIAPSSNVLRRALPIVALVAALGVLLTIKDASAVISFNPTATLCVEDATTAPECDGDTSAGATPDARSTFGILPPDSNFGGVVNGVPAAFVAESDTGITPIGAVVAKLTSVATLGLLGNPCSNQIDVAFTMMAGSVNPADTISPKPSGQSDILEPLALDANSNGVPDGADKYPVYLNELFPGATPVARAIGFTIPAGTNDWVVLNFVVFEPGSTLDDIPVDTSLGYPSAVVLQDPTQPPAQSVISDFCSKLLSTTITFGLTRDNPCTPAPGPQGCPAQPPINSPFTLTPDPDGCDGDNNEASCVIRKNPAAGTYTFTTFARSQRDADDDGIENSLDTCALDPTPNWDPRGFDTTADPDSDGLTVCDPNPNTPSVNTPQGCPSGLTGRDEDQDCYSNRQDNCPIDANDQTDTDEDGIGDACDDNIDTPDGERSEICIPIQVTVGGSTEGVVGDPYAPPCKVAGAVAPPADDDGDGVPNTDDRCANTPAGATVDEFGCTPEQAVLDDDNDGVLNASDSCPGTAAGATVDANGCSAAQLAGDDGNTTDDGPGGPDTGVGALAPAVGSIPAWATVLSGLGGAGLLGSLGAFASRILRRRRN